MATLDKYLSKVEVVETPKGKQLIATPIPDIANKFLLSDTSKPKDPRQQSKIVCQYQDPCADKENQMCYFRGKWCSQQGRVV